MIALDFLGSQPGRAARVGGGLALVAAGARLRGRWLALAAVGAIPLAAGLFDVCLLGPIFRLPLVGRRFRRARGIS